MIKKNYFKAGGHYFFFVDTIPESIEQAFSLASLVDDDVSVYRAVSHTGPWDSASIIGHRPRKEILQNLSLETDEEERVRLEDELEALHRCYEEAGRPVPLTQVAA